MEISNKTLAWFVIGAVVVSLTGSLFSLTNSNGITGYATSNTTGSAAVDVSQSVILRFAINSTDFGAGSIDSGSGANNCTLSINGSATIYKSGCTGFANTNTGGNDAFILENAGTSFLSVTINFTGNATTFIGGNQSVARLKFAVSENESTSCAGGTISNGGWTEVQAPNTFVPTCSNLSYADDRDSLRIGLNLSIPIDANSGARTITVLAQGTNLP
jgi:hypothetical protein